MIGFFTVHKQTMENTECKLNSTAGAFRETDMIGGVNIENQATYLSDKTTML